MPPRSRLRRCFEESIPRHRGSADKAWSRSILLLSLLTVLVISFHLISPIIRRKDGWISQYTQHHASRPAWMVYAVPAGQAEDVFRQRQTGAKGSDAQCQQDSRMLISVSVSPNDVTTLGLAAYRTWVATMGPCHEVRFFVGRQVSLSEASTMEGMQPQEQATLTASTVSHYQSGQEAMKPVSELVYEELSLRA